MCRIRRQSCGKCAELGNLPQRAKDDLQALADTNRKIQIRALAKLSKSVNDRYLRTVGVKLGVDDYARGFTLLVRAWQKGLVELPPPYKAPKK